MCGIAGIHFKNPNDTGISRAKLEGFVDALLLGIEHRGKDSTGLVAVDKRGVPSLEKADTAASKFINWRSSLPRRPRTILAHTRFATQGTPKVLDNNHPIQYESVFVTHNGHINNDDILFKDWGLDRNAEVDSEIIAALIHSVGLDKVHLALQELQGNYAIAAVDPENQPETLVLAKGPTSPLEFVETNKVIVWASEWTAIQDAAQSVLGFKPKKSQFRGLKSGQMLYIEGSEVEVLEFKVKPKWTRTYTSTSTQEGWERAVDVPSCTGCGCKRYWHGKAGTGDSAYTFGVGACEARVNGRPCECTAYKAPTEATESAVQRGIEFCDGCGAELPMTAMKAFGKYLLCKEVCAAFDDDPTAAQLHAETIDGEVVAIEDVDEENDALESREDGIHELALEYVHRETGQDPGFVNWLLFEADLDVFDGNAYLVSQHELADEAYFPARNLAETVWDKSIEDLDDPPAASCGVQVCATDDAPDYLPAVRTNSPLAVMH